MGDTKIIISDDTRQNASPEVIDFLERQAEQGVIVPEAIVSKHDFDAQAPSEDYTTDRATIDKVMTGSSTPDEKLNSEVEDVLNYASTSENNAIHINPMAIFRSRENIPPGEDALPEDFTVATAPNITSLRSFAEVATNIPQGSFAPIVDDISLSDFSTYTLFHEVGHANHGLVGYREEVDAENIANNLYAVAFKEGIVTDPRVPEMMSELRAISSFHRVEGSAEYVLNGTLRPENRATEINPQGRASVTNTINDAYTEIGRPLENARHQTKSLSFFSNERLQQFMTEDQVTEMRVLIAADQEQDVDRAETLDKMEALMAGVDIPADFQEEFRSEVDFQLQLEGFELVNGEITGRDADDNPVRAGGQPELLYIEVRAQLMEGAFDEDPEAKALAQNYVLGAERLAPDHYNVADHGQTYEQHLAAQGTPDTFGYEPEPNTEPTKGLTVGV